MIIIMIMIMIMIITLFKCRIDLALYIVVLIGDTVNKEQNISNRT